MKRLGVANESSHENGHNDDPFNDDMSIDDSASEFGNNIPYANLNGNLLVIFYKCWYNDIIFSYILFYWNRRIS